MTKSVDWGVAFLGGALLALMIRFNSSLAGISSPLFASWVAHAVGTVVAIVLSLLFSQVANLRPVLMDASLLQPKKRWTYLGGVPGAMTVVLAAITVNSSLGFSGSLALMLVGQIVFGIVTDSLGWFGSMKRKLSWLDFSVVCLVLLGSILIIFSSFE